MKQPPLAVGGFEAFAKSTRLSEFLATMNRVLPWSALLALIEPYYAKVPNGAGRRPIGGERMLRIYFLQQWFALSDPRVEESLYDSRSMREWGGMQKPSSSHPLHRVFQSLFSLACHRWVMLSAFCGDGGDPCRKRR